MSTLLASVFNRKGSALWGYASTVADTSSLYLLKRISAFLCPLKGLAFLKQLMQRTGDIGGGTDTPAVIVTQANKPHNSLGIVWHWSVLNSLYFCQDLW